MVPKESGFNQSETACARAWCDVFHARLSWQEMVEVLQRQHFCHHGDTICHPKSGYETTNLHGTSTCGCNNYSIFSDGYFHVSYRRRIPATLIWPQQSLGSSCQTTEITTLLNSISFLFEISFLPKYLVIYYDYIVKWCSGI